jgi:hypothetical protein
MYSTNYRTPCFWTTVDTLTFVDPAKYEVGVAGGGADLLLDDLIKSARGQQAELVRRDKRKTKQGIRSWKLSCNSFRHHQANAGRQPTTERRESVPSHTDKGRLPSW